MTVRAGTWVWLVVAALAVVLARLDPWGEPAAGLTYVSSQSAATRLVPELADVSPEQLQIVLRPTDGAVTQLRPTDEGHVLLVQGQPAGPVDPEALEALVASLRMATSLRAVSDASELGSARRGTIELQWGEQTREIEVGGQTPDRVGLYGVLRGQGEPRAWVVETELGEILDQKPRAWLATRAAVVAAGQVTRVDFGDATVTRGDDGLWRSQVGERSAVLDTETVESRIDRLAAARLDPFLPEHEVGQVRPWVVLDATGDRRMTLQLAGECPGHSGRVVLVRGPGWPGCIDQALTEPWPLPERPAGSDAPPSVISSMVEPSLMPYPYGRVLQVVATAPAQRSLEQRLGDWVLHEDRSGTTVTTDVSRARVYAWYQALQEVEVEVDPDQAALSPDADLQIVTDSTVTMRLRCETGEASRCQRDDGPILRVLDSLPPLSLEAASFAEHELLAFQTHEVRAIEIVPGRHGVRQGAHFDLGIWRLDAPEHPLGDRALDETALETMLATLAGVRAQSSASMPTSEPLRTIRVELTPVRGRAADATLALHEDCVAVVQGRAATLGDATCARLGEDLLYDDPFQHWLSTARSVQVRQDELDVRLEREDEQWIASEPEGETEARAVLDDLAARRVTELRQGEPPTEPTGTVRILPNAGTAFVVHYGAGWARIEGPTWHYRF